MQKEIIILAAAIIIAAASIVTGFTANVIKAVTIQQNHHAIIETDKGEIDILLFEDQNPVTTKNFITLVNRGFYNGLTFHRVVPGFVIQTGDPTGTGAGGPGYTIPDEYSNLTNGKYGQSEYRRLSVLHTHGRCALVEWQKPCLRPGRPRL